MSEFLLRCLIVCPLVFLAGCVDAIAGGGGLISLPAYLLSGLPVHLAIGTNKLGAAMGTGVATWRFARSGYIPWRLSLCCVGCALLGANLGAQLALQLNERIFKLVMLALLPVIALYVLRKKELAAQKGPYPMRKTLAIAMAATLLVGIYDGFYGPGTGTFLLLVLTGVARLRLQEANGATKVINLCTNLSALAVFLWNGKVLLGLGLLAGCFSIAGNYVGARFFVKGGARFVRPVILLVLSIFFVRILWELFGL